MWEYSNDKVLVMSFEEGSSITNLEYLRKNNIDFKQVSTYLSDVFYKQIFEFGFVHSDPHPGNIFVRKEKENGKVTTKIILLDHGLYRDYDETFRYNYCNLWRCK
jgi:aarF domain-containing kinase